MSLSRGASVASQQLPDSAGTVVSASQSAKQASEAVSKARAAESASQAKDPALIWDEPAVMPANYGSHYRSGHPSPVRPADSRVSGRSAHIADCGWQEPRRSPSDLVRHPARPELCCV
jgi:hypothetical protein